MLFLLGIALPPDVETALLCVPDSARVSPLLGVVKISSLSPPIEDLGFEIGREYSGTGICETLLVLALDDGRLTPCPAVEYDCLDEVRDEGLDDGVSVLVIASAIWPAKFLVKLPNLSSMDVDVTDEVVEPGRLMFLRRLIELGGRNVELPRWGDIRLGGVFAVGGGILDRAV